MTLIVALDLGIFEQNFGSLQIFLGFCEMAAGLTKSPSRAMRCGSAGVTVGALWQPELKQGRSIWALRGKKEIYIDPLTETVPPKSVKTRSVGSQISMLWQCRLFWEFLQTNSAQLEVYFCIALRSCYLYWWDCVSVTSHTLEKGFLN